METNRLKQFCLVVETGSLTKAADLLEMTHGGLSKSLQILQKEIGVLLLQPCGRGLEPTAHGKKFYYKAKSIVEQVIQLTHGEDTNQRKSVCIGLSESLGYVFGQLLAESLEYNVDLMELDAQQIEAAVSEKKVDFGFSFVPYVQPQTEHLKIGKSEMMAIGLKSKLLNSNKKDLGYVIPMSLLQDNPISLKSRDGWPIDTPRKVASRASNLSLALNVVRSGKALLYTARIVLEKHNENSNPKYFLTRFVLDFKPPPLDIYLIKRKDAVETKEMKRACQLIRKALSIYTS